jgi:TolB protein
MSKAVQIGIAAVAATVAIRAAAPQKVVFARVWPNEGQIGLFVAARDGGGEHPLLPGSHEMDYDPVWSSDGQSIVFTSDREGSADLFRVKPDGSGLERLTDSPAYDDQAAFSPDGKQLVFVTTRADGIAHVWTLDIASKRAKALTSGAGADFRPSWSPDGQWVAFSSDRGHTLTFARGRWEHLQPAEIYVIHPDGSGTKRLTEPGGFCGTPKWTADSRRLVAYCMNVESTLETRRPSPLPGNDTRLVSIDIATGGMTDVASAPGVKINPSILSTNEIAYIRKDTDQEGIYYTSGARGPKGAVRWASWSPDGARVVFHRRQTAPPTTWKKIWSRNADFDLALTGILPSFSPDGDRFVMVGRPAPGTVLGSSISVAASGTNAATVVYQDPKRNVLAPQWSPKGDRIIFGVGVFNLFFNGFNGLLLKQGDRVEGGAQIAVVNPDGSGYQEVTTGPTNSAFPSMAPDGKRFVYRFFGSDGEGLRIMNLETKAVTTLTKGYANFPLWSPRGDLIMFARLAEGDYDIYTIKPDGTGEKRLTTSHGNDAHQAWSPDGESIVFASSRMGYKDEATYTDAPQPYGEIFVMRFDGTNVRQLTDNQWEDGTPAWQPTRP